jgi:hypothetical protein
LVYLGANGDGACDGCQDANAVAVGSGINEYGDSMTNRRKLNEVALPLVAINLINVPAYQEQIQQLQQQLFAELEASGGLNIPVRVPAGERLDQRKLRR